MNHIREPATSYMDDIQLQRVGELQVIERNFAIVTTPAISVQLQSTRSEINGAFPCSCQKRRSFVLRIFEPEDRVRATVSEVIRVQKLVLTE
jgi:hypothetical protein